MENDNLIEVNGQRWFNAKGMYPEYKTGDQVFIYCQVNKEISKTEVLAYVSETFFDENAPISRLLSYRLRRINLDDQYGNWTPDYIYSTKEDAEKQTKFFPVTLTEQEWFDAIGLKKDSDRTNYDENCELQPCCAVVSEMRDVLFDCLLDGGLINQDIKILEDIFNKHSIPQGENLDKIFDQLGLLEKKDE